MAKAYVQMECDFLAKVLVANGFHSDFIGIIMTCISSVSFSILLKGHPFGSFFFFFFIKKKSLARGPPLTFFILGAEVLSCLFLKVEK